MNLSRARTATVRQHAPQRLTTAEMLAHLVAFDTTNRNSNLTLIGFVQDCPDGFGVPYRISTSAGGHKANIHAIIGPQAAGSRQQAAGSRQQAAGSLALSGHVNTVPVEGQAWSADPFALRRDDRKLYGRGSCDMKGFVAPVLSFLGSGALTAFRLKLGGLSIKPPSHGGQPTPRCSIGCVCREGAPSSGFAS
jgi:acetylornithine deacetylase/succinyl-diaminopimelate desuccinylase-like protein